MHNPEPAAENRQSHKGPGVAEHRHQGAATAVESKNSRGHPPQSACRSLVMVVCNAPCFVYGSVSQSRHQNVPRCFHARGRKILRTMSSSTMARLCCSCTRGGKSCTMTCGTTRRRRSTCPRSLTYMIAANTIQYTPKEFSDVEHQVALCLSACMQLRDRLPSLCALQSTGCRGLNGSTSGARFAAIWWRKSGAT